MEEEKLPSQYDLIIYSQDVRNSMLIKPKRAEGVK